jgi:hypothetical protein
MGRQRIAIGASKLRGGQEAARARSKEAQRRTRADLHSRDVQGKSRQDIRLPAHAPLEDEQSLCPSPVMAYNPADPETPGSKSIEISAQCREGRNKVKAIKMIGLAALAALMAMAFVGATSAMAEKAGLCMEDAIDCVGLQHVHETSVGKAKLLTTIGTTECNALYLGDTTSASGEPLVIKGSFTYSECELGGAKCTATEENGPSEIKVEKTGVETTKVTGEGLVHLVCGTSIDCSFTGTGLVGTGKGPLKSTQANGEVTLSEQKTTKEAGGFLCPKESKLDITTTPLDAVYVNNNPKYWCHDSSTKEGSFKDTLCLEAGVAGKELYLKETLR